ncbi:MAG: hypothetical protein WCA44_05880 [Acidobacteriaceae bacterium]
MSDGKLSKAEGNAVKIVRPTQAELHQRAVAAFNRLRPEDVGCTNTQAGDDWSELEFYLAVVKTRVPDPAAPAVVEALEEAAQSMETIAKGAGKKEFMVDIFDVRGYANSRANAAGAALATWHEAHAKGEVKA